jgi:hypothetical protein
MPAVAAPSRPVPAVIAARVDCVRFHRGRFQSGEEACVRGTRRCRQSDCTSRRERERKISHSFLRSSPALEKRREVIRSRDMTIREEEKSERMFSVLLKRASRAASSPITSKTGNGDNASNASGDDNRRGGRASSGVAGHSSAACRQNTSAGSKVVYRNNTVAPARSCSACATTRDSDGRHAGFPRGSIRLSARRIEPVRQLPAGSRPQRRAALQMRLEKIS